jgi:hypothetical protein
VFALLSIVNVPPYIGVLAAVVVVVTGLVVFVVTTLVDVVVVFAGVVEVVAVVEVVFAQEDSTRAATSAKLNPNHNSFFVISFTPFFY